MFGGQQPDMSAEDGGEEQQETNELAIDEDLTLVERIKLYSRPALC